MKANGTPAVKKNEGEPKKGKATKKNATTKPEDNETAKDE